MSSPTNQNRILFIGYNGEGQFGLGHCNSTKEFVLCTNNLIQRIYNGENFKIFSDNDFKNILSAGWNIINQFAFAKRSKFPSYTLIDYFIKNNIKIINIFTNPTANCAFFKSDTGDIYVTGGLSRKLGLSAEFRDFPSINIIPDIKNATDIKACTTFTIAICPCDNKQHGIIIKIWSNLYKIPQDIINLLILFTKQTQILSTTNEPGSGHAEDEKLTNENGWNIIKYLENNNINIVKIDVGSWHSLFLESNGNVWACGRGRSGQLGLKEVDDEDDAVDIPQRIDYFMDNDIKIRDIKCGWNHNLAIDYDDRIYSWGDNSHGQCGIGIERYYIFIPTEIEFFKDYKVDTIDCGHSHSYVKTKCGKHFMFGNNDYNECMTFTNPDDDKYIYTPRIVNETMMKKYKIKEIIHILPGYFDTTIICNM